MIYNESVLKKFVRNMSARTPVKCSQCGHSNRTGSRFCRSCGHELARPGSPGAARSIQQTRTEPLVDRDILILLIGIFFFVGSFVFLYLVSAGFDSESTVTAAKSLPVLLAFCVIYFSTKPITATVFDSLGYSFLQRNLNIGWLLLVLGVLSVITANLWLPALFPIKELDTSTAIIPMASVLIIAAFYGFWVRSQTDNPLFKMFVENPLIYRYGVSRTVFLLLFSFIFALMALLANLVRSASATAESYLITTFVICTIVLIVAAFISSVFHVPISAAFIARTISKRSLSLEGVFFLGEPVKRFQKVIDETSTTTITEKQLGDRRGQLKDMLRDAIEGIENAEISTAKIPIPATLNLRFGEKEVHKYVQISLPTHAGVIKTFVSLRSVGNKYVVGCSMYFLGEESPQALLRNAFQVIRIYIIGYTLNFVSSLNNTRESLSDDRDLPIMPRIKPAAEMDVLSRANRDEIVDEIAGILWLTVSEVLRKFEQISTKNRNQVSNLGGDA